MIHPRVVPARGDIERKRRGCQRSRSRVKRELEKRRSRASMMKDTEEKHSGHRRRETDVILSILSRCRESNS